MHCLRLLMFEENGRMTEGTHALVSSNGCALEASAHWLSHWVICARLVCGIEGSGFPRPSVKEILKKETFVCDNGVAIISNNWYADLQSQKGC